MTQVVAIHQPNYFPWLGYFAKVVLSDVFVFLDDAQFSKNSYTNRTRLLVEGRVKWLTVPVSLSLGDSISDVRPKAVDWPSRHLNVLANYYRSAPAFDQVWPFLSSCFLRSLGQSLAEINQSIAMAIADQLGLARKFLRSSEIDTSGETGDRRLARIVKRVAPGGTYLSGAGGAVYQSECTFARAGISLVYVSFAHPRYRQSSDEFVAGLSILDALFNEGWQQTGRMIRQAARLREVAEAGDSD